MISNCYLVEFPKFSDARGNLCAIEAQNGLTFDIKRVYYLYDIGSVETRGYHAHKELEQLIIPISGSFDIYIDDGFENKKFKLSQPNEALYVCPMIWREISNFSNGAVVLVLASSAFDENDYIRDYDLFLKEKNLKK